MAQVVTASTSKSLWLRLTPDAGTTVWNISGQDVFAGGFRVLSIVLDVVTAGAGGSAIGISSGGTPLFTGYGGFVPTTSTGTVPLIRQQTTTTGSIGPSDILVISTINGGSTSRLLLTVSELSPRVVS